MNYYELIYLKNEFKNKLMDARIEQAITPYKNLLELYIEGQRESFRLIFSSAPGNTALFLDTYRPAKKSNRLLFFEDIYGAKIIDINVAVNDRFLSFSMDNGHKLIFRLFSTKANTLLVQNGVIKETFKDFGEEGDKEPTPKQQILFGNISDNRDPKSIIISANPLLSRSEIDDLIVLNKLKEKTQEEIFQFTKHVTQQISKNPVPRKLETGSVTLLSEEFLPVKTHEKFDSINKLISFRFKNYSHNQRLSQQKGLYNKGIKRDLKRLNSSLNNLSKADKGIEKSGLYEKYGHLLMANAHLGKPDNKKITVQDLYQDGQEIEIQVNPELSFVENAEHYYNRSSSSIRSFEEAEKRIPKLEARKQRLTNMFNELERINHLRDLEEWKKRHQKEIENLALGKTKKLDSSLPFHTLELKGFQVWIGKNAKSNDKIVQLSHKEDIWMHARGVPGSHLVIRMGNDKGMPSKDIIQSAASFAAYNSKAKGAKLVPVIFTKRKYVRKPKGAAPGAVLVQKEEVELVKPEKPDL